MTKDADYFAGRLLDIRKRCFVVIDNATEIDRDIQRLLLEYNSERLEASKALKEESKHDRSIQ